MNVTKPEIETTKIKMLVYGQSGVGKTHFCGTAEDDPRCHDVLYGDVEGGTLTLHSRGEHLDIMRLDSFSSIGDLYDATEHYRCVVIDSLGELQKYSMDGILSKNNRNDVAQIQDWGTNLTQLRRVVRLFRDLDIHLIVTCLEKEDRNERTGDSLIGPNLTGALRNELPGYFDIVGRLCVDITKVQGEVTTERKLIVAPDGKCIAKDRSSLLGAQMINPTVPMILDRILS